MSHVVKIADNDDWVQPRMYQDIVNTIKDNIPNIEHIPGKNTIMIIKKDMQFEVTDPHEVEDLMQIMWDVNNFICRQYRRRKHILKSTVIIDG